MADRQALTQDQKFTAWQREVNDRLGMLERRKTQGDISLDTLHMNGATSIPATASTPMVVRGDGSAQWKWDLEKLGSSVLASWVARDELGRLRDIVPKPLGLVTGGAAVSCATGALVTTLLPGSLQNAQAFSVGDIWDAAAGALICPISGVWEIHFNGGWQGVADNTERFTHVQLANVGGGFATFIGDTRTGAATAAEGVNLSFNAKVLLAAGARLRLALLHRSATTPINYIPNRFSVMWVGSGF